MRKKQVATEYVILFLAVLCMTGMSLIGCQTEVGKQEKGSGRQEEAVSGDVKDKSFMENVGSQTVPGDETDIMQEPNPKPDTVEAADSRSDPIEPGQGTGMDAAKEIMGSPIELPFIPVE